MPKSTFDLADFDVTNAEFPDTNYHIISFSPNPKSNETPALSFFSALNPTSNHSGIRYCLADNLPCQGQEMIDATVTDTISRAFKNDQDFLTAINSAYRIIIGEHFDLTLRGKFNNQGGSKGVLDFLILPLLARKLIADTFLDSRKDLYLTNLIAWAVALPIEIARFSAAVALTIAVSPIVALVHLAKASISDEQTHSKTEQPTI